MYGIYAWNAGALAAQIQTDLVALLSGALIDELSASANKPGCSVEGAASGWAAHDAAFGVLKNDGLAGGPGVLARITVSATPRVQLAVVDGWVMGSHSATYASSATDVSTAVNVAGSLAFVATPEGLLLAASDWSLWGCIGEVKRDGPALGDALAPGGMLVNASGNCYLPRVKAPGAVGDVTAPSCTFASAYGSLSASAARDRLERLYLPMAPAVVSYSSVPVGEVAGLQVVGGYAQSGDFVQDAGGDTWQIAKYSQTAVALKRV